jgi:hypothetical protein
MTAPTTQPPSWFGRAVTDYVRWLSQHWTQSEGFTVIRELERLGLCTLLNNEDYVLAMVSALGDCRDPEPRQAPSQPRDVEPVSQHEAANPIGDSGEPTTQCR